MDENEAERRRKKVENTRRWRAAHPGYWLRYKDAAKRWRERNRDRHLANRRNIARRRYWSDREKLRARHKAWYAANRARWLNIVKQRRLADIERVRAQARENYARNAGKAKERVKAWRLKNIDLARLYLRKSKLMQKRAAGRGTFTASEWIQLVLEHSGCCAYCGEAAPLEIDHRVPLSRGGSNTIDNILPACRPCNRRKHMKTEAEFRALLAEEATRERLSG